MFSFSNFLLLFHIHDLSHLSIKKVLEKLFILALMDFNPLNDPCPAGEFENEARFH